MISKCAVLSLVLCHSALVQCLFSSPHYSRELWRNPNSAASNGLPLCPSLPVASLSADQLLAKLQESLKQVDQEIQAALQEDKSPGGAVVSVVYGDGVIWSKGYGLKNMSGEWEQGIMHLSFAHATPLPSGDPRWAGLHRDLLHEIFQMPHLGGAEVKVWSNKVGDIPLGWAAGA